MKNIIWLAFLLPTLAFANPDNETFVSCAAGGNSQDCHHINEAGDRLNAIEAEQIEQNDRLDALEAGGSGPTLKTIVALTAANESVGDWATASFGQESSATARLRPVTQRWG